MKLAWVAGLPDNEKNQIKDAFSGSKRILTRLATIVEDKITFSVNEARSRVLYENPGWPYQQADAIGYQRALSEIQQLLTEE